MRQASGVRQGETSGAARRGGPSRRIPATSLPRLTVPGPAQPGNLRRCRYWASSRTRKLQDRARRIAQIHRRCPPRRCSEGRGNCPSRKTGYPSRSGRTHKSQIVRPEHHVAAVAHVREERARLHGNTEEPAKARHLGRSGRRNEVIGEEPARGITERKLIFWRRAESKRCSGWQINRPAENNSRGSWGRKQNDDGENTEEFLHEWRLRCVYTKAVRSDSPRDVGEGTLICDHAAQRLAPVSLKSQFPQSTSM